MATAAKLADAPEILPPSTDIQLQVEARPEIVLLDPEKFDQFYTRVKAETDRLNADTSTRKGREEIRSMAARVTKTKTLIDRARLRLTEQWRTQTNEVNAAWKGMKPQLETLADEVRKPLTEWEEAEEARVERCTAAMDALRTAAIVTIEDTAATVKARGKQIWDTQIDTAEFQDLAPQAEQLKAAAVETLKAALARLIREEAEREELERLRAENVERELREAAAREAAEAERQLAAEAERKLEEERQAELARVAAEEAEAERIERARRDAADQAKRKAEAEAERERQEVERAKQAEIDAATARAEQAERLERERLAQAEREAAEQKARDANKAHRKRVMAAAKEAIITCGADEDTARKIVLAIVAGEVPQVTLRF